MQQIVELTNYAEHLDVYPSDSSILNYNKRILGDATGEMGPFYKYNNPNMTNTIYINNWYSDSSNFVNSTNPWFSRGGYFNGGAGTGQFNFLNRTGIALTLNAFRITLAF